MSLYEHELPWVDKYNITIALVLFQKYQYLAKIYINLYLKFTIPLIYNPP